MCLYCEGTGASQRDAFALGTMTGGTAASCEAGETLMWTMPASSTIVNTSFVTNCEISHNSSGKVCVAFRYNVSVDLSWRSW